VLAAWRPSTPFYTGYDKAKRAWAWDRVGDLLPFGPFSVKAWNKLAGLCSLTTLGLAATRALAVPALDRAVQLPSTQTLLQQTAAWAALHTVLTLGGEYRLDPKKVRAGSPSLHGTRR
jgi:hypothetical protein